MSTACSGGKQKPGVVLDEALQALAAGELELSAEQLASISGLAAAGRRQVQETLQGMDAAARFSCVDRLITVAEMSVLYDFSAVCLDCLEDADAAVRALAASGFADDEGRDTLHRLVELARHDPEASVRSEAALALGPAALRAEFDQLQQADRELVVGTLRAIASDATEEPAVQASALANVGVISEAWVRDLIFDAYESGEPALRLGALQAMGRSADDYWLPTLINALAALDEDERIVAAQAVGEIGHEDAIVPLAELLDDESLEVVEATVLALGEIGGPAAREELERYADHPEPVLRAAVQAALEEATFVDNPLRVDR